MKQRLTIADTILIIVAACLIVASYVFANLHATQGSMALVQVDGKMVYKTSLSETRTIMVDGIRGTLMLETREGKVAITQANCPNHVCIKTGWRSRVGDIIVCVPNKVVVRIIGSEQKGVRATTG